MSHADRLRSLANDVERYERSPIADDLRRAVGVEVAVLGAEIMADDHRDAMKCITIDLTNHRKGVPYVVTEHAPRRGGPLRRLAARLQRHQR